MKKTLEDKAKKLKRHIEDLDLPALNKLKAVAIKYNANKDKAPKIIATGRGSVADSILKLAEEHRIPMFEDKSLTELLSKLELDTEIPAELYTMVAEVLAFVYQLDKLTKQRKGKRNG